MIKAAQVFHLEGPRSAVVYLESELQIISDQKYALIQCLIFCHRKCPVPDSDRLAELARMLLDSPPARAAAVAEFLVACDDVAAAAAFAAAAVDAVEDEAALTLAFVALAQDDLPEASALLEEVTLKSAPNAGVSFLRGFANLRAREFDAAAHFFASAGAHLSPIGTIERLKASMMISDWADVREGLLTVNNEGSGGPFMLIISELQLLLAIVHDGDLRKAASAVATWLRTFDETEAGNFRLLESFSTLVVSLGESSLAEPVVDLIRRTSNSAGTVPASVVLKLAELEELTGQAGDFQRLVDLDPGNRAALIAVLVRKLGELEISADTEDLYQFLKVTSDGSAPQTVDMVYAELLWQMRNRRVAAAPSPDAEFAGLVDVVVKEAIGNFKRRFDGLEFFRGVNFWFFMRLSRSIESIMPQKAARILETVLEFAPGLAELKLRLAKLKLKLNEVDAASKLLYLHKQGGKILARLKFKQGYIDEAVKLLQGDLSASASPLYLLLVASRDFQLRPYDLTGALAVLAPLLTPNVSSSQDVSRPGTDSDGEDLCEAASLGVRLSVAAHDTKRARQFLRLARGERNPVLQADILLLENEPEKALGVLQAAVASAHHADVIWSRRVEIAQKMADIYLTRIRNKDKFVKVFSDLVSEVATPIVGHEDSSNRIDPDVHKATSTGTFGLRGDPLGDRVIDTLTLLGEAYLRIQQPQEAVAAFRKAVASGRSAGPVGASMSSWLRLGNALVKVHEYTAAFELFADLRSREQLSKSEKLAVRRELCSLLVALGREEEAAAEWQAQIDLYSVAASEYRECGAVYEELAKVESRLFDEGKRNRVLVALEGALNCYSQVRGEELRMSELAFSIAQHFQQTGDLDTAIKWLSESLRLGGGIGNAAVVDRANVALANIHLSRGDLNNCDAVLKSKLGGLVTTASNPLSTEVNMLKAEIAILQQGDLKVALSLVLDVLKADPAHPVALIKALHVLRRLGLGGKAVELVNAASEAASRTRSDPQSSYKGAAVNFAKGLLAVWGGDLAGARVYLGHARAVPEQRLDATLQLVEALVFAEFPGISVRTLTSKTRQTNTTEISSRLKEIQDLVHDIGFNPRAQMLLALSKILAGSVGVSTDGTPANLISGGFGKLTELLALSKDHISVLTSVAIGNIVIGQLSKARPLLKRVQELAVSAGYSAEEADDVQRALLLSADLAVDQGKGEAGAKMCHTVLGINKSISRAHELLGEIAEKANAFGEATKHFRRATFAITAFCPDGVKADVNELETKEAQVCCRAGQWVRAIEVARKSGNREILERARANLRN